MAPMEKSEAERFESLRHFLFEENGFRGSKLDYYNRSNSYLNELLEDREGLPITLSVLYMALGQRIGLKMAGVSLPGHFVVKWFPETGEEQLIDVFHRARPLSREEAAVLGRRHAGGGLRKEHLEAAAKREIVLRMLRNLLLTAEEKGSSGESLHYLDVILALAPDAAMERGKRALARFRQGDIPGARADFEWLLENNPEGMDVERLRKFYEALPAVE
jgi:serine protease Do